MAISQSLRDLANLQPATRRQVDQIGTRLDTIELRTKMYGWLCLGRGGLAMSQLFLHTHCVQQGRPSQVWRARGVGIARD